MYLNKWFTYFYLGHRTSRYLLWIMHIFLLVSNSMLVMCSWLYILSLAVQLFVYMLSLLKIAFKLENKIVNMAYYYCVTVIAQIVGVYNVLTGKAKPFWEKAESTR